MLCGTSGFVAVVVGSMGRDNQTRKLEELDERGYLFYCQVYAVRALVKDLEGAATLQTISICPLIEFGFVSDDLVRSMMMCTYGGVVTCEDRSGTDTGSCWRGTASISSRVALSKLNLDKAEARLWSFGLGKPPPSPA